MKGLFFVLALLIGGCSDGFKPKTCDFCKGDINFHKVEDGNYRQQWKNEGEKHYHNWCLILKDRKK